VIVYKLGRSEVGQDLAASHTGAMAGADEMADAFFRAHGMLRVDTLETLFELPALLEGQKPAQRHRVRGDDDHRRRRGERRRPPRHARSRGRGADRDAVSRSSRQNIGISRARLTDLTLAGAKKEIYSAVLNALLASDHCDLVLAVAGSSAQFQPQIAIEPLIEAERTTSRWRSFAAPHAEPRSSCWPRTKASRGSARRNPAPTRSAPGATGGRRCSLRRRIAND
jgi:acetate---CoA ligase (ADP-forming)